jgi:hypothetical protein
VLEQQRQRLEAEQSTSDFDSAVKKLTDQRREAAKPNRRAKKSDKKPTEGEA